MRPNEVLIQPESLVAGHFKTIWGQAALRLQRSAPNGSLSMAQTGKMVLLLVGCFSVLKKCPAVT